MSEHAYLKWFSTTPSIYWHDSAVRAQQAEAFGNGATGMTTNPFLIQSTLNSDRAFWADRLAKLPRGLKGDEKAMELLKVFDLEDEAETLSSNLPYGKQRKLEIARAMATDPKLLLLDEPAAGMNPNETAELMDTIRLVRDRFDMTILLIEHDMRLVSGICERLTVLNFGRTLKQGPTAEVLNDPEVIKAYLGD